MVYTRSTQCREVLSGKIEMVLVLYMYIAGVSYCFVKLCLVCTFCSTQAFKDLDALIDKVSIIEGFVGSLFCCVYVNIYQTCN